MRDGPTLVFVEVKTRRARRQGYPEEAVTALKLRHTVKAAAAYRTEHRHTGNWRVDVVSVSAAGIRHLENVTAAL
jgi:Holliday junction resolvase-like predicted endonuclease